MTNISLPQIKEKFFHPGFQRYFKNTGWMFFGQVFNMAVAFFVGAYVARYLGPANFGLMSYAISFASLFGFLAGFGVDSILQRELVKTPDKKDELLGTSLIIKLVGGGLAIGLINVVSSFMSQGPLAKLLILIFSLTFIGQSLSVINLYFQAQVLSRKTIPLQIALGLISALLKMLIIWLDFGVIWITAAYVADSLLLAAGLTYIYFRNLREKFKWNFNVNLCKRLLRDALPLMLTIMATTIYSKIDQVMLKQIIDETSVGLYSVAVKLSEIWYFIPSIICASLFPAIVNAKKIGDRLYSHRLQKLYRLMLVLAISLTIPLSLAAPYLINIIFGPEYLAATGAWRIYIWSSAPVFMMVALSQFLINENYTKIFFLITIAGAGANILLNLFLIPRYGINGSALATLISYSLVPILLSFFNKTRGQLWLIFKTSTYEKRA